MKPSSYWFSREPYQFKPGSLIPLSWNLGSPHDTLDIGVYVTDAVQFPSRPIGLHSLGPNGHCKREPQQPHREALPEKT